MTKTSGIPTPRRFNDVTIQVLVMLGVLVALILATGAKNPSFFSAYSFVSISRDVAIMSLFALGQAIVIISGGIDLSVGSMLCFLGVINILLLNVFSGMSFGQSILVVGSVAGVVGFIHGVLVCYLRLQPFLVTLCSLLIFRGLSRVVTDDATVAFDAKDYPVFADLGQATWDLIPGVYLPISVYVLIAALIPLLLFMHCTVPGRYLYAIGYNLEAARFSGVRVNALRIFSYILCALLTGVAAILEASTIGSRTPSAAGLAYEMYGITAAVLGGCSLRGGQGSLVGVIIGVAMLRVIRSAVIYFDWSTYWTFVFTGFVLLIAVIIDAVVRRRRVAS
jgi:ribose transport system permease protein